MNQRRGDRSRLRRRGTPPPLLRKGVRAVPLLPRSGFLLLQASLLSLLGCDKDPAGDPFPETQGIDPVALEEAYQEARAIPGSLSLLVQRNGATVREEYFHGFGPDSLHDVRSVTKSVVALLVGVAIEEGLIPSIDEPIGAYVTPVVDSIRQGVAQIPLRHFLSMSSGLDWHELDGGDSYSQWWESDDMIQFVVDLPLISEPGTLFTYNTGASHLLSVVLTQASGMPTLEFARTRLFHPMGFSGSEWLQENRGYDTGGMGLRLTAGDMVKLGQLVLDEGVFQGTPLVPSSWVRAATEPHHETGGVVPYCPAYGFLFWLCRGGGREFVLANGYGGQFILIDPELALVVVAQSRWRGLGWVGAGEQWMQVLENIVEGILPSVQ